MTLTSPLFLARSERDSRGQELATLVSKNELTFNDLQLWSQEMNWPLTACNSIVKNELTFNDSIFVTELYFHFYFYFTCMHMATVNPSVVMLCNMKLFSDLCL